LADGASTSAAPATANPIKQTIIAFMSYLLDWRSMHKLGVTPGAQSMSSSS
jgi:hypothetical protein